MDILFLATSGGPIQTIKHKHRTTMPLSHFLLILICLNYTLLQPLPKLKKEVRSVNPPKTNLSNQGSDQIEHFRPLPGPTKRAKGPSLNDGPKGLQPGGGIPGCGVLLGVGKSAWELPVKPKNLARSSQTCHITHWRLGSFCFKNAILQHIWCLAH
jgi:hypothetical protein